MAQIFKLMTSWERCCSICLMAAGGREVDEGALGGSRVIVLPSLGGSLAERAQ